MDGPVYKLAGYRYLTREQLKDEQVLAEAWAKAQPKLMEELLNALSRQTVDDENPDPTL